MTDETDAKIAAGEARTDTKIERALRSLDARFAEIDARFARVDTRFAVLEGRLDSIERRLGLFQWVIGLTFAATLANLGGTIAVVLRVFGK